MLPDQVGKSWYRGNYLVSTDRNLLQPAAINAAFDSDALWWAKRLPDDLMEKMLSNSLCLGLYVLPESKASIAGRSSPEMIGLSRVVTDYVSFAYLTDVYVLEQHQRKGLGRWMIECLNETLEGWPALRRLMLLSSSAETTSLYQKVIGVSEWDPSASGKAILLQRKFGGLAPQGEMKDSQST